MTTDQLDERLAETDKAVLPHHSRVHPLRSFASHPCFIKREDELGFGISGTKLRKYLSLLPSLLKEKPSEAIVIGSAYSNHVLSISQLLKENGVNPILFLLGDPSCKMQGNLLYSALVAEPKNIHWIARTKWHEVDQIADSFVKERVQKNIKAVIVPKGANCEAALPGALTLAQDILRNERESGIIFEHLFIESGTGMTACALLLAFSFLQKPIFLHIVQVAGSEIEFHEVLAARKKNFETLMGASVSYPTRFKLYTPSIAPTFGSTHKELFKTIAEMARTEGFLTDPVFTAKLFYEGKKILAEQLLKGPVLFIHSGGGLGLTGFQDQLAKIITDDKSGFTSRCGEERNWNPF